MRFLLVALLCALSYAQTGRECIPVSITVNQDWCNDRCPNKYNDQHVCPTDMCLCRAITTTTTTTKTPDTPEPSQSPSFSPTLGPTQEPTVAPTTITPSNAGISSTTETPEINTVIFDANYLQIIGNFKALFLQECTSHLQDIRCVQVISGSIILTIEGPLANVPLCMKLPSFPQICQESGARNEESEDDSQASIWILVGVLICVCFGICCFFGYTVATHQRKESHDWWTDSRSMWGLSFQKTTPYSSDQRTIPSSLEAATVKTSISEFSTFSDGPTNPAAWHKESSDVSSFSAGYSIGMYKESSEGRQPDAVLMDVIKTPPNNRADASTPASLYGHEEEGYNTSMITAKRHPEKLAPGETSGGGETVDIDEIDLYNP